MSGALLAGSGIGRDFTLPRQSLFTPGAVRHAVVDASLEVGDGETVGLIGESGSGKSTLVRILLALDTPTTGRVQFDGRPVAPGRAGALRWFRRQTGVVLQDPYASLDPRMRVFDTVREPLRALDVPGSHRALVAEMLDRVGLPSAAADRYPHEFSGGQRQRIALARALVHGPRLLVGDEPLSALDVTVRAQILQLLRELRDERGLAMLIVSHDLGLVNHLADRVAVMRAGRIVEQGATEAVLRAPKDPYTRALIAAVPTLPA
ncbi:ATP-binding cassette domain-containing protein [Frondihabitans australicus]|uniref:Peptide/nickel transport system ATP-binding protein n=1 Tax=Frondihabitans australicus TaxID=386892 RepID=A0A495ICV8_9MICO|nr:ATP-binding cassette domain-containing protein [Frondihabitans australicus]RKR73759.1 peptide/nickel transport system ATP-binding protein [Frondihabitans australicus]